MLMMKREGDVIDIPDVVMDDDADDDVLSWIKINMNHEKQARKLQATLVRNYHRPTRWRGWSVELLA